MIIPRCYFAEQKKWTHKYLDHLFKKYYALRIAGRVDTAGYSSSNPICDTNKQWKNKNNIHSLFSYLLPIHVSFLPENPYRHRRQKEERQIHIYL